MRKTALALLTAAVLVAGCGGGKTAPDASGAKVFASAGCGGCHTLSAAKSKGQTGPDLDQLRPSYGAVVRQVSTGGAGMPSFSGKLNKGQIRDVANYVVDSTKNNSVAGMHTPLRGRALRLLQASVREHRLLRRARDGACAAGDLYEDERGGQHRLPPDRALDRPRRLRALSRQRRAGAGARLDDLLVGLLPRCRRAGLRRRAAFKSRLARAEDVHRERDQQDVLPALPVRPRARTRADDLQPQRPALLAQGLQPACDGLGSDLLHRRRLHAELPPGADADRTD